MLTFPKWPVLRSGAAYFGQYQRAKAAREGLVVGINLSPRSRLLKRN
jgi:hypothetical protein